MFFEWPSQRAVLNLFEMLWHQIKQAPYLDMFLSNNKQSISLSTKNSNHKGEETHMHTPADLLHHFGASSTFLICFPTS